MCCCRWKIEGLENFPEQGHVIVIANHVSYWDPVVIAASLPRQVFFMAKKELFSIPVLGLLLKSWGAFPVERGRPDRDAIKHSLKLLGQGKVVGIFPEGARSKIGSLLPPTAGTAYLAVRAGVPVCPVALLGTNRIITKGLFQKVSMRIGRVTRFERHKKQDLELVARQMMLKIQDLLDLRST